MLKFSIIILTVTGFVSAKSINVDMGNYSFWNENYGRTWMYFPDGDGNPRNISLIEHRPVNSTDINPNIIGDKKLHKSLFKNNIYFEIYTRNSTRSARKLQQRFMEQEDFDEKLQGFRNGVDTKIIIHGWNSDSETRTILDMKDAYLSEIDCNVIAVDWGTYAFDPNYTASAEATREVGRYTAELINSLVERGTNLGNIHIIGHSMGAHVAGCAGAFVKYGLVSRITGLDPARPFFLWLENDSRLDYSDAEFVDIIHTTGGTLGIKTPMGHVDFYPNGGVSAQPGCQGFSEFLQGCSHTRSHQYFTESIRTKVGFYGHLCESWDSFEKGECNYGTTIMGEHVSRAAIGSYYLKTNSESPYALGYV